MATETPTPTPAKEGEILASGHTFGTITDKISSIVQGERLSMRWLALLAGSFLLVTVLLISMVWLLHKGRPWYFYWMLPLVPNTLGGLGPQYRSPLVWDVFAIGTYSLVSLLFWFVGLVPDMATLRDRAKTKTGQIFYGILAMGWRG